MAKAQQKHQDHDPSNPYAHLPVAFTFRAPDGEVIQVIEPCYRLLADGFYGIKAAASMFQEGEIIFDKDIVPNHQLEPLNQAAGQRVVQWLSTLPLDGQPIGIGDLAEAAHMLRPREGVPEMNPLDWGHAVQKLALELKAKREGRQNMHIPPINPGRVNSKAPGMLATRYTDPSHRGPGDVGNRPVIHEPVRTEQPLQRATPAMTGAPAPAPAPSLQG